MTLKTMEGCGPRARRRFAAVCVSVVGFVLCALALPLSAFAQAVVGPAPTVGTRGIPDGRGYEQVSPTDKTGGAGGVLPLINLYQLDGPLQASPGGEAITYLGEAFYEPGVGGVNQYRSGRQSSGWGTANASPPTTTVTPALNLNHYVAFSTDLTHAVRYSNQPLAPGAPTGYRNLWLLDTHTGVFQPLVTATPPNRGPGEFRLEFAGASSDFSRIFFQANDALTPEAEDHEFEGRDLYEWHDGVLRLVNLLGGGSSPNAFFGAPAEEEQAVEQGNFKNAISLDGSRAIWADLTDGALYSSEAGSSPVQLDKSEGPGSSGGGTYLAASSDGSRVFFSDSSALTADSTASGTPDLYEYSFATGKLTDLTVDPNVGEQANVIGVVGASTEGAYVYFIAQGILASGASSGEDNMYLTHEGHVEFIATLSSEDENDRTRYQERNGLFGDWAPIAGHRTADVTHSGRYVAFQSVRNLTGYEGGGTSEVFLYDATKNELVCASCNPSGAAPSGLSALPVTNFDTDTPQWLSEEDGGRLVFDSIDALVPWDTNGREDVYEYENGQVSLISAGTGPYASGLATASENETNVFFTTSDELVPQDEDELVDLYDARIGGGFPAPQLPAPCSEVEGCRGASPASGVSIGTPSSALLQGSGNATPTAAIVQTTKKTPAQIRAEHLRKALKLCKLKQNKHRRATCEATARHRYGARKPAKAHKGR